MALALRPLGFAAASAMFFLAFACGSTRGGKTRASAATTTACRVAHDGDVKTGVAGEDTWLTLAGFSTQVNAPQGWQYAQQGSLIVGHDAHAEYVVMGACTRDAAKAALSKAANDFGLELSTEGASEREVVSNGLKATRRDFTVASVRGRPAHGVAVVADAPKGNGFVVLLGWVERGDEDARADLAEVLGSLSAR